MSNVRPEIPAELKRRILVEAGHRCAIPTCRTMSALEIAHIIPWINCKEHSYENLIALCANCHTMADKGHIDRKSLYVYKDNLRYVIEKYSAFEIDALLQLTRETALAFPPYLSLLIKRLLDDGLVELRKNNNSVKAIGLQISPDFLFLTEKGKLFVNSLSKEKIGYSSEEKNKIAGVVQDLLQTEKINIDALEGGNTIVLKYAPNLDKEITIYSGPLTHFADAQYGYTVNGRKIKIIEQTLKIVLPRIKQGTFRVSYFKKV